MSDYHLEIKLIDDRDFGDIEPINLDDIFNEASNAMRNHGFLRVVRGYDYGFMCCYDCNGSLGTEYTVTYKQDDYGYRPINLCTKCHEAKL